MQGEVAKIVSEEQIWLRLQKMKLTTLYMAFSVLKGFGLEGQIMLLRGLLFGQMVTHGLSQNGKEETNQAAILRRTVLRC